MERKTKYCKRIWVNPEDSAATGSIVCYDGFIDNERVCFFEVASCHSKARLHMYKDSDLNEFITKLSTTRDELNNFIEHLNKELEEYKKDLI